MLLEVEHGGELRDLLYVYLDRTGKKIYHSIILNEFSCGKVQIFCLFRTKSLDKSIFHARCIFPNKLEQRLKDLLGLLWNKRA